MREPDEKSGGVGCFILGVVGFMLLPLYVFSFGPAYCPATNYPQSQPVLHVIYWPIGFAAACWPPIHDAIDWDVELWT